MEIDQHDAGPSRVTPLSRSFLGRVQAEPANNITPVAVSASRSQESPATTSSGKGKERERQTSPAPPRTVLPYDDVQMDKMAPGTDAFDQAQGTLFPEFTGQEPLKNIAILGDQLNTKGVRTLFVRMGNYVYAYQGDIIACTLKNYNRGRQPPTPSRRQANATICFKDRIMGPVRLYNMAGEIRAIFATVLTEEEGRAPSYHQASDLITFLHLWRRFKAR